MFPEESYHYPIWLGDGEKEWDMSLSVDSKGFIRVSLQTDNHTHTHTHMHSHKHNIAMFNQLRTLGSVRLALEIVSNSNSTTNYEEDDNVNSCLEYLRQSLFCHSDNTLEGAGFFIGHQYLQRLDGII
jgi:hypothetical protein